MKGLGLRALALLVGAALPAQAAKPCAAEGTPFVAVETRASTIAGELGPHVIEQLRAGLSSRKIGVCESHDAPAQAPIARIALEPVAENRVVISVEVSDAITDKKLSRDVDLSSVPRDAWALTLALAADEALRASWAELALRSSPPPKKPVPPEVKAAVDDSMKAPKPREESLPNAEIGAAFVASIYAAGQKQAGIDARGALFVTPTLFLHLRAGLRSARDAETSDGRIRSRAIGAGIGPGLALTRRDAVVGSDALLRFDVSRVRFEGEPNANARGTSASATAIYAEGAIAAWVAPEKSLRLLLELASGVPLRAATANDGPKTITGLDGVSLSVALGLGGRF